MHTPEIKLEELTLNKYNVQTTMSYFKILISHFNKEHLKHFLHANAYYAFGDTPLVLLIKLLSSIDIIHSFLCYGKFQLLQEPLGLCVISLLFVTVLFANVRKKTYAIFVKCYLYCCPTEHFSLFNGVFLHLCPMLRMGF